MDHLRITLRARKYNKCMKTWHEASTSGYSRELKRNSKVVYCLTLAGVRFTYFSYLFHILCCHSFTAELQQSRSLQAVFMPAGEVGEGTACGY